MIGFLGKCERKVGGGGWEVEKVDWIELICVFVGLEDFEGLIIGKVVDEVRIEIRECLVGEL
ncbi:hypothetical protein, partial [Cytobacillus oceanisediminis]|uniref:hypothetical protein n=1 Tax=Cytobacillus oceanisediminis TaxID=665099 RepID=UPI0011A4C963